MFGVKKAVDMAEKKEITAKIWEDAFNAVHDLVSIQDKDFKYIRVNKAFADLFKVKPEDMIGKTCYEFIHHRDSPFPGCPHKEAIETKKPVTTELFEPRLGLYLEVSASPLFDENGDMFATVHLIKDITERKKTENEIKELKDKFETIFEGVNDGIIVVDSETKKFLFGNKSMHEMLGYNQEKFKNLEVKDIHPQESLSYVMDQFEKQARREILIAKDIPVKRKDGSIFYVDINSAPIVLGGRKYLMGVFRDITGQKKIADELRLVQKQVEYILGATKTGLDIIDSKFNIQYIDPEWQKVYGDFKGKKCYEYFMGRSEPCPNCGIVKALETKKPVVAEEVLAKEGNRHVQVTTIPFENEKGEWMVAEVNVDITERKKIENELKAKMREMERFFKATMDREKRILELKQELKKLKK